MLSVRRVLMHVSSGCSPPEEGPRRCLPEAGEPTTTLSHRGNGYTRRLFCAIVIPLVTSFRKHPHPSHTALLPISIYFSPYSAVVRELQLRHVELSCAHGIMSVRPNFVFHYYQPYKNLNYLTFS